MIKGCHYPLYLYYSEYEYQVLQNVVPFVLLLFIFLHFSKTMSACVRCVLPITVASRSSWNNCTGFISHCVYLKTLIYVYICFLFLCCFIPFLLPIKLCQPTSWQGDTNGDPKYFFLACVCFDARPTNDWPLCVHSFYRNRPDLSWRVHWEARANVPQRTTDLLLLPNMF